MLSSGIEAYIHERNFLRLIQRSIRILPLPQNIPYTINFVPLIYEMLGEEK